MTLVMEVETASQIIDMYKAGRKIGDIERELGVSRSSIYYVLKKNDVTPGRAIKPYRRLRGDDHDLSLLYSIIEAQEARIDQLLDAMNQAGVPIPAEPTQS